MPSLFQFGSTKLPEIVYRQLTILLIGSFAHWMLYGVLLVQVCLYYASFPNDHLLLKLTVFLALALETAQTTLFTQDLFRVFSLGFENLLLADEVDTIWIAVPLMTGLIAFLAQTFYCYRTAVLTRSKYAVALIAALAIAQTSSAIGVAEQGRAADYIADVLGTKISVITVGIWGASGVGCDIAIAVIMVYHLKKKDTGFQNTHNIIQRLIRLTIETGFVTASFAVISLALSFIPGHPPYYQPAFLILAKVYSNSMVAALNSRMKVMSNSSSESPPSWNELEILSENAQSLRFAMTSSSASWSSLGDSYDI